MSVSKKKMVAALSPPLHKEIVTNMLDSYLEIKQQFFLRKFRPSELDGGRFAESVLRLIEQQDTGTFTPFGQNLSSENIINRASSNMGLHDSLRLFIPRQARIMLDVRNRRDVAHVGGDVSPNYADSVFICHVADWVLTEIVRIFYNCPSDEARKIVSTINEVKVPIVADVNGFLRVQNSMLDASQKALVILYHKDPEPVRDSDLATWLRYKNVSRWKTEILAKLDAETLIHYDGCNCHLLPKGKLFVDRNIPLELLV
jgi:hypothetical protein